MQLHTHRHAAGKHCSTAHAARFEHAQIQTCGGLQACPRRACGGRLPLIVPQQGFGGGSECCGVVVGRRLAGVRRRLLGGRVTTACPAQQA
eukprot:745817-Prymnesium_polylepis.1